MSHTDIFEIPTVFDRTAPTGAASSRFGGMWSYWAATVPALALGVTGWPAGIAAAVMLADLQILHLLTRGDRPGSFPLQVRFAYLALLLAGCVDGMGFLHWIQLVGTLAFVTVDYCPLARLLSLAPWNRGGWNDPTQIWARLTAAPQRNVGEVPE